MTGQKEYLAIPGYLSTQEAAERLGITDKRVLQLIKSKRLPAKKVRGRQMILLEDFENFHTKAHGQQRERAVAWRIYRAGAKVYALQIAIQARPEKREELQARLQAVAEEQRHQFKGTMLRHVFTSTDNPNAILIELVWKDTELIDEADLQRDLDAFKAAFADVLDWETARYTRLQALIHT